MNRVTGSDSVLASGGGEAALDDMRDALAAEAGSDPVYGGGREFRQELMLAVLPTVTVVGTLYLLETVRNQRLLLTSLASSALLMCRDPLHQIDTARSLLISRPFAAVAGRFTFVRLGHGHATEVCMMLLTISAMSFLNVMHPPAVSASIFELKPRTNSFSSSRPCS